MAKKLIMYKVFLEGSLDSSNPAITNRFDIKRKSFLGLIWLDEISVYGSKEDPLELVEALDELKKRDYCAIDVSEVKDYINGYFYTDGYFV